MLLACKFEEVNPLAIEEFVYISDNSYNKDEILRMESQVLRQLDFTLSASTSKARSPVWRGHP
jgi:cyclin A